MGNLYQCKTAILAKTSLAIACLASAMGVSMLHTKLLVYTMAADYITGLIVAGWFGKSNKSESGKLNSRAGAKGLFRKVGVIVIIMLVNQMESIIGLDYITNSVFLFFLVNEFLSVLENFGLMGVQYPTKLKEALEVLKEESGGKKYEKD